MPQCLIALFAVLAAWLQTSALPPLPSWGTKPDLLLSLVVLLALYDQEESWPLRYWLIGLLKDVLSAGPLGIYAFVFTLVGLGISKIRNEVFRDHPLTRGALVFFAVVLANGSVAGVQNIASGLFRPLGLIAQVSMEAGYSALLAPPFLALVMLFRAPLQLTLSRDLSRAV